MRQSSTTRTRLYMERVLEQTCRPLASGGDHDLRAFIARRLATAADAGWTTLGELGIVARKALVDYTASVKPRQQLNSGANLSVRLAQVAE